MQEQVITPEVQYTLVGVILLLATILAWVVKKLFRILSNELHHIRGHLDRLACGKHGQAIENLEKRLDRRETSHQFRSG